MKKKYVYEGRVYAFNTLVAIEWKGTTYAPSDARAISNLKYQFREKFNYNKKTPISLPGRLEVS